MASICRWVRIAALTMLVLASGGTGHALAQTAAETGETAAPVLPDPLTPEAVNALIARLSDDQVRALLIEQLDARASAPEAAASDDIVGNLQDRTHLLRERIGDVAEAALELPGVLPFAFAKLTEGKPWWHPILVAGGFAVMLGAGFGAAHLFGRLTGGVRESISQQEVSGALAKVGYLLLRLTIDLVSLAVFVLAAVGAFFIMYQGHLPTRQLVMTYLAAVVIVMLVTRMCAFFMVPYASHLRLLPMDDATARALHRQIITVAAVWAFGVLTNDLLGRLGLDPDVNFVISFIVGSVITLMIMRLFWRYRHVVANAIREANPSSRALGMVADLWHLPGMVGMLLLYALIVVERLLGLQAHADAAVDTFLAVIFLVVADRALCTALAGSAGQDEEGAHQHGSYEPVLRRGLRVTLWAVMLLIIGGFWGVDIFDVAEQQVGASVMGAMIDIGLTLLLANLGWQLLRTMIDRRLAEEAGPEAAEPGSEGGGQGATRLSTLLPIIRNFLFVTLVVMVAMIILSSLGVDIGPILAGAGVVGLAVGFGAQALVKDIVSGVFFLFDDAFRLGEYIDIGDVKGTVEKISIRSMRLRHHRGPLHTVPFGEIQHLTNYSRDWVIMKMEFRVPYETDLIKVKRIFKQIGAEIAEDPEMGPNLLQPLKSQGVKEMDDSAMIIRAKFMAKPGEQFIIRREVFSRVQKAFAENGIEFARRQVMVHVPPGEDAEAGGAAAAAAIQQAEAEARARGAA